MEKKMGVVFLEDRPLVIMDAIKELRERNYEVKKVFWFYNDLDDEGDRLKNFVNTKYAELEIPLVQIDEKNFTEELDKEYRNRSTVFFFDMDLSRDFTEYFEERINVQYAMRKQESAQKEKELFKIWFYTTGPVAAVEQITSTFENHYLPVTEFKVKEKQIVFDYNYVENTIHMEVEKHLHE